MSDYEEYFLDTLVNLAPSAEQNQISSRISSIQFSFTDSTSPYNVVSIIKYGLNIVHNDLVLGALCLAYSTVSHA